MGEGLGEASDNLSSGGMSEFFELSQTFFQIDKGFRFESDANDDNAFLGSDNRCSYLVYSFGRGFKPLEFAFRAAGDWRLL